MSKIKTGTTLTTAYQVEGDTTGTLVIQTGSTPTTAVTVAADQNVTVAGNVTLNNGNADGAQLQLASSGYSDWNLDNYSGRLRAYYGSTEYFTINSSGNVGIGTSSPAQKLSVNGSILATQGNKVGVARSDGALVSYIANVADNETQWRSDGGGAFSTFYTAGSERARIDSSGNLLVGTTNASATAGNGVKILPAGYSGLALTQVWVGNTTSSSEYWGMVRSSSNNTWRFYGDYAGNLYAQSTSIISLSDARLKENIRDLETGLQTVMALKPRRFDWKEGQGQDKKDVAGFIAQEVEPVLPEIVSTGMDKDENGDKYKMLAPGLLIPTLVKAIQEQQAIITSLTTRIEALESK